MTLKFKKNHFLWNPLVHHRPHKTGNWTDKSYPRHLKINANVILRTPWSMRKDPPVPVEQEAGWTPERVWALWRGEKSLLISGNRTPDHPARSLSWSHATLTLVLYATHMYVRDWIFFRNAGINNPAQTRILNISTVETSYLAQHWTICCVSYSFSGPTFSWTILRHGFCFTSHKGGPRFHFLLTF